MCGLAGYVGRLGAAAGVVRGWGRTLEHRGPDDCGIAVLGPEGFYSGRDTARITPEAECALWHRRLSILDLSELGWQPMRSSDGRHHLILTGEIYNYVELRAELEAQGVTFRSRTDTEVLLEYWRREGVAILPRLIGMFVIVVLDTVTRRIVIARDPFGIKPLHYVADAKRFAFASEPKALLELPDVSRRVDAQRMYDYLRFGLTDHADTTMLAAIRTLPAAHWMEVAIDGARAAEPVRYWTLRTDERWEGSFEQAAERMRALFLDSVRLHLRSDVPVGAALSGGVDSSAIVTAMRAAEPALDLHTFSYVADDAALNEERWATIAGTAAGATIHRTHASSADLIRDLDALLRAQDEPFGSTSIYAQFCVFRLAKEHGITVMLDGQGADELLGGYLPYASARLASLVRQGRIGAALAFARRARRDPGRGMLWAWAGEFLVPAALQAPLRGLVGQELVPAWLDAKWFAARGVRTAPAKYASRGARDVLREQLHRATTLSSLPMLLRYEDRNSMAFSIESRVPFLTPQLAQFAMSLPEEYVIDRDGTTKAVFRRAMRGLVPDAILDRRDKIGFATPEQRWMPELAPQVERLLSDERMACIPALRGDALRAEWRGMLAHAPRRDFRAWRWFNLIEWASRVGADFS